jgi:hypothetical protein
LVVPADAAAGALITKEEVCMITMHDGKPRGFPSSAANDVWPRAWKWGVDYAQDAATVIAVRVGGGGDHKYDLDWIGPIPLTEETAAWLEQWAEGTLMLNGGYVHLLPATGDATPDLEEALTRCDDDEEEDGGNADV